MISVTEAKNKIQSVTSKLPATELKLIDASGLILAEAIYAPQSFPPFPQSAMDGYAFNFKNKGNNILKVSGLVQAGETQLTNNNSNHAVRIFTGAPVPHEYDTVIMQEKVSLNDGHILIQDENITEGTNVRQAGSEIKKGALALPAQTLLTPAAIGFLAGLGLTRVKVTPKPVVSIIVTGKELQLPGNPLQHGQVYESNSYALTAALARHHVTNVSIKVADDDLDVLISLVMQELEKSDVLLLTGGVSVGDYDFVTPALQKAGVETVFHKVKQKPGKPFLFGTKGPKLVFGLPGNPSSVLTCFYEYVLLGLQQLMGLPLPLINTVQLPLSTGYHKTPGLTHFLKGLQQNGSVLALDAQESFKMRSFALANCLIVLEEGKTEYKQGDMVEVHLLPG